MDYRQNQGHVFRAAVGESSIVLDPVNVYQGTNTVTIDKTAHTTKTKATAVKQNKRLGVKTGEVTQYIWTNIILIVEVKQK